MTLTLDATPGGTASNSYGTRDAADAYFEGRLNTSAWSKATPAQRDQALVAATSRLDAELYDGTAVVQGQRLKWPRVGLLDENGWSISWAEVPRQVQEASFEQALFYLQNPTASGTNALAQFDEVTVGPISVTPSKQGTAPDLICPRALQLLAPFRVGGAGTGQFRIDRG